MHPQVVKALAELNIGFFFTDAREFKRKGNTEMYKLAVAHIKRLRKEINDARMEMREEKSRKQKEATMEGLIEKYKKEVENISRTCETLEEECNALHEVFESLFYTLEVRSGLIVPLEFLQKEIVKVLDDSKHTKVLQLASNEFQIIIGTDALIDETKTRSYVIAGIKFTVMESFDRAQRWLHTIDDTKLSKILESYAIKNGGKLWN